jgi:hypothetical protein
LERKGLVESGIRTGTAEDYVTKRGWDGRKMRWSFGLERQARGMLSKIRERHGQGRVHDVAAGKT